MPRPLTLRWPFLTLSLVLHPQARGPLSGKELEGELRVYLALEGNQMANWRIQEKRKYVLMANRQENAHFASPAGTWGSISGGQLTM